jgi:hypothetical protein
LLADLPFCRLLCGIMALEGFDGSIGATDCGVAGGKTDK